jgi:hypothetical protein
VVITASIRSLTPFALDIAARADAENQWLKKLSPVEALDKGKERDGLRQPYGLTARRLPPPGKALKP